MRIAVTGGRDFKDEDLFYEVIDNMRLTHVIYGDCPTGLDHLMHYYLSCRPVIGRQRFKADWDKEGKAAGPIRNRQMIDEGRPKLLVAFPGGRGTADCMAHAKRNRIPVLCVQSR